MKNMTYDEVKNNLEKVLEMVAAGEEIIISSNGGQKKVAAIIPFDQYKKPTKRRLGKLKAKATYRIKENFKMSDEEFLAS